MPQNASAIPLRKFGRYDVRVSALGFGGHNLGDAADPQTAIRLVRDAVDGVITFFDNCWEYHPRRDGRLDGQGLKGIRFEGCRPIVSIFGRFTK